MIKLKTWNASVYFIATLTCFIVLSRLFFPPNLNNTPVGIDFYNYYAFSQSKFSITEFTYPRPIFWLYLRLIGLSQNTEIFFILLAIPSFVFISSTYYVLIRSNLVKCNIPSFLMFHSVIFLSSTFFIQFKADPGAMLAGIFAIIAMKYTLDLTENRAEKPRGLITKISLFIWFSAEAKPQFSFVVVFLVVYFLVVQKNQKFLLPGVFAVLIPSFVFLKDKILDSPFLMSSESGSPYAVVLDPKSILNGIFYYLEKSFSLATLLVFVITFVFQILHRQFKLIVALIGILISILFPLALIPNHLLPPYAWYGTYVIAIWLTIGLDRMLAELRKFWHKGILLISLGIVLVFSSGSLYSPKYFDYKNRSIEKNSYVKWILERQAENGNLEKTVRKVEVRKLQHVLFGGVYGPWHLLRNSDFVRAAYPNLKSYYVYLQNSESVWNSVAVEMDTGFSENDTKTHKIEWVVLVNQRGLINEIVSWSEFSKLEKSIQIAALDTGILLDFSPKGKIEYEESLGMLENLMKANSHENYLSDIKKLYNSRT